MCAEHLEGDAAGSHTQRAALAAAAVGTIRQILGGKPIRLWLSFAPIRLGRALSIVAIVASVWFVAGAAELDGVQLPSMLRVDGKALQLNGFGLRTYSILRIHIYVAALYLEHLSTSAEEIIRSPETKLLTIRFEHSVSADAARRAWRKGLENNCQPPCYLDPEDVERFLGAIPAIHVGDSYSLLFTGQGVTIIAGGHQLGRISRNEFAEAMLATFLGRRPASPRLKQDLLRGHG